MQIESRKTRKINKSRHKYNKEAERDGNTKTDTQIDRKDKKYKKIQIMKQKKYTNKNKSRQRKIMIKQRK